MTDEEIMTLALSVFDETKDTYVGSASSLIAFARSIEQKVREECAVICEDLGVTYYAREAAEAIRARGTE